MKKLLFILVSIVFISCSSRKVLVDKTDIKTLESLSIESDYIKYSPLSFAISKNKKDTVEKLISNGYTITKEDANNAVKINQGIAKLFIEKGVYPSVSEVLLYGSSDIVMQTLEKLSNSQDADFNKKDTHGNTYLHIIAARKGCDDVIDYLIERGANANLVNKYNNTALKIAMENKNISAAEKLIELPKGDCVAGVPDNSKFTFAANQLVTLSTVIFNLLSSTYVPLGT
jgi:ankyrin repeat protein